MSSRRPCGPGADRGQTLPDFAVGVVIFLITVAFIVVFVPQLTLQFEDTEQPVVADRAAHTLGADLLVENATSELHRDCTLTFFDSASEQSCPFDEGEPLETQLGIQSTYSVNVSLRSAPSDAENSTILCDDWSEGPCEGSTEPLTTGPATPKADHTVATARRSTVVDNSTVVLEVVVW